VRRTRRDLSNPKIKRVIAKEIKGESKTAFSHTGSHSVFVKFFKVTLYILILGFLGLAIYSYLPRIFPSGIKYVNQSNTQSSSPETQLPKTNEGKQPLTGTNQTAEESHSQQEFQAVPRKTQVEVLNGAGVDKIASRTTEFLRKNNIDVVSIGNYSRFNVRKSFILNRSGNSEKVNEVAKILGIPADQIQLKKDSSLQLDATIVLGADYKKLNPFQKK